MQLVKPTIQTFADPEDLAQAAAARFVQLAESAIAGLRHSKQPELIVAEV